MNASNGRTTKSMAQNLALVVVVLPLLGCGSSPGEERIYEQSEPLVVQQVNAMRDLRQWGSNHLRVTWSNGTARISNDGDSAMFCGASSTQVSYQPDHYYGIRAHRERDIAVPASPIVRCHLNWEHAARIVERDERVLGTIFEEPKENGEPAETNHGASIVMMPDPMPNLGVQIDDRYTLLD